MILGKKDIKPIVSMGTQQSENANTIPYGILNTFLFLLILRAFSQHYSTVHLDVPVV